MITIKKVAALAVGMAAIGLLGTGVLLGAIGGSSGTPLASEYKLTGLTILNGARTAYLVRHEANDVQRFLRLREGDRIDDLAILEIDSPNRRVRVRYGATIGFLDFASHGIRPLHRVEEIAAEHVRVHTRFVEDHKRAHEERYRREFSSGGNQQE